MITTTLDTTVQAKSAPAANSDKNTRSPKANFAGVWPLLSHVKGLVPKVNFAGYCFSRLGQYLSAYTGNYPRGDCMAPGLFYYRIRRDEHHASGQFAEDKRIKMDAEWLRWFYSDEAKKFAPLMFKDTVLPYHTLLTPPQMEEVKVVFKDRIFESDAVVRSLMAHLHTEFCRFANRNQIENSNNRLIRISSAIRPGDVLSAEVVDYNQTIANLMIDFPLEGAWKSLREYEKHCVMNKNLQKSSPLASPLGVAALVVTNDGYLLLSHRSGHVSSYANVIGPCISGYAMDGVANGFPGNHKRNLRWVCSTTIKHEAQEEVALGIDESGIQLLGLYYENARRLPQAFLLIPLKKSFSEVCDNVWRKGGMAQSAEVQGILAISKREFAKLMPRLLRHEIQGIPQIGLEAQALLAAAATYAADDLKPKKEPVQTEWGSDCSPALQSPGADKMPLNP